MAPRSTWLLTRSEIRDLLSIEDAIQAVEEAFEEYGRGRVQMPPKPYLYFDQGDLRCMPAFIPALGLASVKNVNAHPGNRDLPAVMATVTIFDPETGFPLAIMDGTYLTALRTGAAGGIAAAHLARPDCAVAAFIGCGRQARTQLAALMAVLEGIERVLGADIEAERAEQFAAEAADRWGVEAAACSAEQAVSSADVLTTVTPSEEPIVRARWVRPGTHINAVGADAPGKQELEAELLRTGKVVVDNWEQARHGGEINVACSEGMIEREDVHADIGQVVAGEKPGRESPGEVTIFDSTGLAIQDLACAARVYRAVREGGRAQAVRSIDFGG